jgi:aryl-alcohol dehydrogenase-like predicted oxidoreductase
MEYTHLGRSGVSVSRLCLGTMNFGWVTDEPGANFFDTANAGQRAAGA